MAPGVAGADQTTGLLPRSSYISCLLTEAVRRRPYSVVLFDEIEIWVCIPLLMRESAILGRFVSWW